MREPVVGSWAEAVLVTLVLARRLLRGALGLVRPGEVEAGVGKRKERFVEAGTKM